jgi:hypothetical protein
MMRFRETVKFFSHVLGFSCLLGTVYFSLKTFYDLFHYDYIITMEPNKIVLATEFILISYALVYLMFLMSQYFYNKLKEELQED